MRSALVPLLALVAAGCGDSTSTAGQVDGTLSGFVYLTAPVGGVVVTAYPYDAHTGAQGPEIAHSDPSMPDGSFKLDLGIYFGPFLLEARGNGATYTEPSTGQKVTWDAAQALRGVWTNWSSTKNLIFDWNRGDQQGGLILSPWSHFALTVARATSAAAPDFITSLQTSLLLFHDHVEADFWSIQPADLTAGASQAWVSPVTLGLELAGLSTIANRMAQDSMTGAISSIDLFRVLDADASDGVFDGHGPAGSLTLGKCKAECYLSGATLRTDFADSMALFLGAPANMSTLAASTVNDFLVRVATRKSPLFPADIAPTYDVTPPTIAVVDNTAVDENSLTPVISGPPPGTISYNAPANGQPTLVTLNGSSTASFGRFASHYGPSDTGIPVWRFQITDDHSPDDKIDVQVRVVNDSNSATLVPWFASTVTPGGAGYNHQVVISNALHPNIGLYSAIYRLEIKATDEKGNVSPVTVVKWQQTILVPPVRQRAGSVCDPKDGQCPSHYSLSGALNADVPITGAGLPNGRLRIGHLQVDNPSPIPVRVWMTAGYATGTWSRGRLGSINPYNNQFPNAPTSPNPGCGAIPDMNNVFTGRQNELLDNSCYSPPQKDVEVVDQDQPISHLLTNVEMTKADGSPLGCNGNNCNGNEYDVPPASTIDVWVTTPALHFFWPTQYPLALNQPGTPSGTIGGQSEQWVMFSEQVCYGQCGGLTVTELYCQTSWWLTRLAFTPSLSGGIRTRLVDPTAPPPPKFVLGGSAWPPASFTSWGWSTNAPGQPTF